MSITIHAILHGPGLVGRAQRYEVFSTGTHTFIEGFDTMKALSKWLSVAGYAYVPGTSGVWSRW